MTGRQKADAEEQRPELFRAAKWTCVVCGEPLSKHGIAQLAHRVPKRQSMLMKWGPEVINSPLNMVPVCSLPCNDAVSLGTVNLKGKTLLAQIVKINTGRDEMPDMGRYYADLRKEFKGRT